MTKAYKGLCRHFFCGTRGSTKRIYFKVLEFETEQGKPL